MIYSRGYVVLRSEDIISLIKSNDTEYTTLIYIFSIIEDILSPEDKQNIHSLPISEDTTLSSLIGIDVTISSIPMAGTVDVLYEVYGYIIHGVCVIEDSLYKQVIPSSAFPLNNRTIESDVEFFFS